MKSILLSSILVVSLFASCNKLDIDEDAPKCVKKEIKTFNKKSSCDNAKVDEFKFQGKTVYAFESGNCHYDRGTKVIDGDCNELGFLGGISGNTKINGEEFSNAVFVKTIWKKP